MTTYENKFVTLKHYLSKGQKPSKNDFEIKSEKQTYELKEHQFICQSMYLSIDPYLKFAMVEDKGAFGRVKIGEPLLGIGCGKVIESRCPEYVVGDIIMTYKEWNWPMSDFSLMDMNEARETKKKITEDMIDDPNLYPALMSVLGMTGLTAYFAVNLFGRPESGKTIAISCAAGAVGHIAGQLAKYYGMRVMGVTSSDEKARILIEEFGFDDVIIYKDKSKAQLIQEWREKCPSGIDYFIDSVGGDISTSVVHSMNRNAKICVVGQISQYNNPNFQSPDKVSDEVESIIKERDITKKSFMVKQMSEQFDEGFNTLQKLLGG
jgi:NADPH-dependent curcumin reductase CurA